MLPRRTYGSATVLALGLLACVGADEGDRSAAAPVVRDSAGIRIVEHPAAVLEQSPVALGEPVLAIGAAEGDGADVFGSIAGVVRLVDGAVAVLDRQAAEVRVFAPDGTLRTRFGRSGGGPGEFESPSLLLPLGGDTLGVVDQFGYRVHRFTAGGTVVDAERLDRSATLTWGVAGRFDDGAWLVQSRTRSEGPPVDGRQDAWILAGVRRRGATITDSLTRLRAAVSFIRNFDQGFSFTAVPFAPAGSVAPLGDAVVAHDGDQYALRIVGRDAAPHTLVRVLAQPPMVTEAHLAADLERRFGALAPDRRAAATRDLEGVPREARHGGFGPLRSDRRDRVWSRVIVPPPTDPDSASTQYLVVAADGMIRARVILNGSEQVAFLDSTHVVTIGRDALDVEQVRVYALPESLRPSTVR